MSQQIRFFDKSAIDLGNDAASINVTDTTATNNGQSFVDFMRNRNNSSSWMTTGSNDAANTTLVFQFGDVRDIKDIMIVGHNLAAYTLKYWDGISAYVDFATPISVSGSTDFVTHHQVTEVSTDSIQLVITGAQVVDADKSIRQFIITNRVGTGQLDGWPVIKNATHSTNKKISSMLSGKVNVVESVGAFACELTVTNWNIDDDLSIIEEIYFGKRGVLVWLSGGDEDQFSHKRVGYRLEDIFLMRAVNDYQPDWAAGLYTSGIIMQLKLREAIN